MRNARFVAVVLLAVLGATALFANGAKEEKATLHVVLNQTWNMYLPTVGKNLVGLALALALNQALRTRNALRAVFSPPRCSATSSSGCSSPPSCTPTAS